MYLKWFCQIFACFSAHSNRLLHLTILVVSWHMKRYRAHLHTHIRFIRSYFRNLLPLSSGNCFSLSLSRVCFCLARRTHPIFLPALTIKRIQHDFKHWAHNYMTQQTTSCWMERSYRKDLHTKIQISASLPLRSPFQWCVCADFHRRKLYHHRWITKVIREVTHIDSLPFVIHNSFRLRIKFDENLPIDRAASHTKRKII